MAKFRSAKSYYGRSGQAKENQRKNLIPGGPWQKKRTTELRLNCWWRGADIESQRFIFEGYENKRDIKDIPMGTLKDEKFLNNWWGELDLYQKRFIYKAIMDPLTKEEKIPIFKNIEECLYVKQSV